MQSARILYREGSQASSLAHFLQVVDCCLVLNSEYISSSQSSSSRIFATVQLGSQLLPVYAGAKDEYVRPACLSSKCGPLQDCGKVRQSDKTDQVKAYISQEAW
jgi:hypothetical protein